VTIGPEFLGGVLFPALVFGLLALVPWLDRTNRRVLGSVEYLQPPTQAPVRLALGAGALTLVGMLLFAAYYDELGLTPGQTWLLTLSVPLILSTGILSWIRLRSRRCPRARFDPTTED